MVRFAIIYATRRIRKTNGSTEKRKPAGKPAGTWEDVDAFALKRDAAHPFTKRKGHTVMALYPFDGIMLVRMMSMVI